MRFHVMMAMAALGGLLAASVSAQAQDWRGANDNPPASTAEYTVCKGEYEHSCMPHQMYVSCAGGVERLARELCERHKISVASSRSGDSCGYSTVSVVCYGR